MLTLSRDTQISTIMHIPYNMVLIHIAMSSCLPGSDIGDAVIALCMLLGMYVINPTLKRIQ